MNIIPSSFITGLHMVFTWAICWCMLAVPVLAQPQPPATYPRAQAPSTLPGITEDNLAEAMITFRISCDKITSLPAGQIVANAYKGPRARSPDPVAFQMACIHAKLLSRRQSTQQEWLAFLDNHFMAVPVTTPEAPGLMTAYSEPVFPISLTPTAELPWPLYRRNPESAAMNPFFSRKDIEQGLAAEHVTPIAYTSRWWAFYLNIQGSGLGQLADGTRLPIVYQTKNGHPYVGLGQRLIDMGEIPKAQMSMQAIKSWLDARSKEEQDALYWVNPSYVFYDWGQDSADRLGPPGAMDLPRGLTAYRSVAIDWAHFSPGMPFFAVGTLGNNGHHPQKVARLVIAQDRGGAIKTRQRMDLFIGNDPHSIELANATRDEEFVFWKLILKADDAERAILSLQ